MPVVKPSFPSESRFETSKSGSFYSTLVANFHLGLLALITLVGARYIFNIWYIRRRTRPTPQCSSSTTKVPGRSSFVWETEEKSRGVSILVKNSTMSAEQPLTTPFSSGGVSDNGQLAKRIDSEEVSVDIAAAETSEGLVLGNLATSPLGHEQPSLLPLLSRPPPPPPLTLPQFSPAVFNFDDRRRSFPPPALSPLDTKSFIHQPNLDYVGSSTAVAHATVLSSELPSSATSPRRRSYTKTVSFETPISGAESSTSEFAPSSFPSTSPSLPPPAEFPETATPSHAQRHEVDIHGEIISSFDDAGQGWKRHTRVYGGGVCLACLQSGGEGGFYGENVRPEDRR